ncbi:MAG: hypothetical protein R3F37_23015, partial [Candidatus Competibacteraceae bacterium]
MISKTNIPPELRERPQWVCWRYEQRGNKTTKAPINARSNGKLTHAKSNDPTTWADLDTALKTREHHPTLAGIGFCFSPSDGLTGIDLDHVIDPDTGEVSPETVEILEHFKGTYIEVSPSGTGLRLFCFGKPKRSGKNVGKVKWLEVYAHPSSRYLTVTGNHRPESAANVTEQQGALDWLHERFMVSKGKPASPVDSKPSPISLDDAGLLEKARRAKNGTEFDRLWSGDISGHGGDHSAADQALCNLLAFWTDNDPERIDRLFRQSGLMRPKWDSKRGEAGTYGAITIAKAINGTRETYHGQSPIAASTNESPSDEPKQSGDPSDQTPPGRHAELEIKPGMTPELADDAERILVKHAGNIFQRSGYLARIAKTRAETVHGIKRPAESTAIIPVDQD